MLHTGNIIVYGASTFTHSCHKLNSFLCFTLLASDAYTVSVPPGWSWSQLLMPSLVLQYRLLSWHVQLILISISTACWDSDLSLWWSACTYRPIPTMMSVRYFLHLHHIQLLNKHRALHVTSDTKLIADT